MYRLRFLGLVFLAVGASARLHYKRATAFYDPADQGGSMLTDAGGLGEPLNVSTYNIPSLDLFQNTNPHAGHRLWLQLARRPH